MGRQLERWLPLVAILGVVAQVLSLVLQVMEPVWRPGMKAGVDAGSALSEVQVGDREQEKE